MKNTFVIIAIHLFSCQAFASGDPVNAGARSWAMGNASIVNRDAFSLFNNPAGVAGIKNFTLFSGYDRRYNLVDLQTVYFGIVKPMRVGTAGLSVSRFGGELYHEHQIGLVYSHKINLVSIGGKVNLIQIAIQDLGSKKALTFEIGAIADIIPKKLLLGMHIYNFTQTKLATYQDERLPTIMKAGLSYMPIEKLNINIETEKDIDFPAIFKWGIEYEIVKYFKLRTGINTKPFAGYFGFGVNPKNIQFDYAFRTHPVLGSSHHISLSLKFNNILKAKV